jgi:hypothetical protein
MTWDVANNFHRTRRPLSYFVPEQEDADLKTRGFPPRWDTSSVYYGVSLIDEAKKDKFENVIGLLKAGVKLATFRDFTGAEWSLEEFSYLRGWKEVVELIQRDPAFMDRPRRTLIELAKLYSGVQDGQYRPDIVFTAGAGSNNSKKIYAHYFMLYQNAPMILKEYGLLKGDEGIDCSTLPTDLNFSTSPTEVDVKEDPKILSALMEWTYTGVLRDATLNDLENDKLIPELRGAAFHFKLTAVSQACGRWVKKQFPIFVAKPQAPTPPEQRLFQDVLCPYIDSTMKYDATQLKKCLMSRPDRMIVAEERPIFVHSALLIAASDYFDALFSFNASSTRVEIQDTSYEALWNSVSYIYAGRLAATPSVSAIMELQNYCSEIMIPHMRPLCEAAFLTAEITPDTAFDYLEAAIEMKHTDLENKCLKTIGPSLMEIVKSDFERFKRLIEPRLPAVYAAMDPTSAGMIRRSLSIHLANL